MRIILVISFLFLTSIIHACPNSNCGGLLIKYPFKLPSSKTAANGCSYVDLRCNEASQNSTVIDLPNTGDLYVRNISYDYEYPYIQLYDAGDCLIQRLINSSLSLSLASSPLVALGAIYALYTCPAAAVNVTRDALLYRIDCLSNTTNVTVAVDIPPPMDLEAIGCQEIGSYDLPFLSNGFNGDLFLTWDWASCPSCANTGDNNSWNGFSGSPYFNLFFVVIVVVVTSASFLTTRKIVGRLNPNTASDGLPVSGVAMAAPPPAAVYGGLEESKIESYTKLIALSESIVDCGSDSHGCPICLESFEAQELVRSIVPCHHCFHADCILTWLIKSRTCPVCRIILSDIPSVPL